MRPHAPRWRIRMKNVAVTGISGYIGDQLLRRLDKLDGVERIVGLCRSQPKSASPKLRLYSQCVRKPFGEVLSENGVDSAIHLAFVVPPAKDRNEHEIDIEGSRNFLQACDEASVKNLMYVSSHTVYGPHRDNPVSITEDRPLRPLSSFPYSWNKAQAERMFQEYAEGHPEKCVTIVRSCTVVGPTGSTGFNVLLMPVMVRVSGYDPPWQFVHEDDLLDLMLTLLTEEQGGVFNAAGEVGVPYSEIISTAGKLSVPLPAGVLSRLLALSWRLHLQSSSPVGGLEYIKYPIIISTEKLKQTLGFRFAHTSREALLSFLQAR
jgi:UDP-glucose 4-epimerase